MRIVNLEEQLRKSQLLLLVLQQKNGTASGSLFIFPSFRRVSSFFACSS